MKGRFLFYDLSLADNTIPFAGLRISSAISSSSSFSFEIDNSKFLMILDVRLFISNIANFCPTQFLEPKTIVE